MKCKNCNHEKIEHYQGKDGKLYPSNCGYINCNCKWFIPQDKQKQEIKQ